MRSSERRLLQIAILDRLVHDAHRIELMGESMRKIKKRVSEKPVEISE